MKSRTSLCMIARNEADNLPRCLGSAARLADEVIVVDTGSDDRTREVAASFGARVIDFAWCDDFAAARNESLRHATGAWVFWLDADEWLEERDRDKLRALLAGLGDDHAAYLMRCFCLPEANAGTGTWVDHARLFRNRPDVRWQYRIHEQILPALGRTGAELRWTDIVIQHGGYQDPALHQHKRERNLRLLELENAERPGDPYILFHLGFTCDQLGRPTDALGCLFASLQRAQPGDSYLPKLHAVLVGCHRRLGRLGDALAACQIGLAACPNDGELLLLQALLLREQGRLAEAERDLRHLLDASPAASLGSVPDGLRSYLARHNLAVVYQEQGRLAEAEEQWRAVVSERPDFTPACLGLADVYIRQGRWRELEQFADDPSAVRGACPILVRARGHLARGEFDSARQVLQEAVAAQPQALWPHVLLAQAYLQEGHDPDAAERALRAVLEMDPRQAESWANLARLLGRQGRLAEMEAACREGRSHCPADADLLALHGLALFDGGDPFGAETAFRQLLQLQPETLFQTEAARERRAIARHHLGRIYLGGRRLAEAEAQWRAILADRPDWLPAQRGLAAVQQETSAMGAACRVGPRAAPT
jgi:tetratricopeptide (TPR) repeat protein